MEKFETEMISGTEKKIYKPYRFIINFKIIKSHIVGSIKEICKRHCWIVSLNRINRIISYNFYEIIIISREKSLKNKLYQRANWNTNRTIHSGIDRNRNDSQSQFLNHNNYLEAEIHKLLKKLETIAVLFP